MFKYVLAEFILFATISIVIGAPGFCGTDVEELRRVKRYGLMHYGGHAKGVVRYKVTDYSKKVSVQNTDKILKEAFDLWASKIHIQFIQLDSKSEEEEDITIRFATLEHGDGFPFDGPGNVLGHAMNNFVHFDDDETWKLGSDDSGSYLPFVATHEIGHALGLDHSEVEGSIMYAWYTDKNDTILHEDDIMGMLEIYKKKKDTSDFNLNMCKDPFFDVLFQTADEKLYIFKSDVYYELDGVKIISGPKKINELWRELPSDIDAAFSQNGKTYFFKDGKYWRYTGFTLDKNYPERLARYYSEIPNILDSAMVGFDGKVYFFRGSRYFRMDAFNEKYTNVTVGKIPDIFLDIPTHINEAFYYPQYKQTYFFKDGSVYVYNHLPNHPPPSQVPVTDYWFNCRFHGRFDLA